MQQEERLHQLFANVSDWLKFAEAKNLGLMTLNAAVVVGFTQINFAENSQFEKIGFYFFTPLATLSFLFALISLFPILAKIESGSNYQKVLAKISNWITEETHFENIHYYGYLKTLSQANFETKFLAKTASTSPFSDYEKELSTQILYNSRITFLKYQLFKIGAAIFLFAFLCTVTLFIFFCLYPTTCKA